MRPLFFLYLLSFICYSNLSILVYDVFNYKSSFHKLINLKFIIYINMLSAFIYNILKMTESKLI